MPQVTVYIREEDLEKWKAIEKKSEFIHNALTSTSETIEISHDTLQKIKKGNLSVSDICKQHGIDKNLCRMMKHT